MYAKVHKNALPPPPNAKNRDAVEVLRVWAVPSEAQQVSLKTTWEEPGTWGLMLADLARHAAKAYAMEGHDEAETLSRILKFLHAELTAPTVEPRQI